MHLLELMYVYAYVLMYFSVKKKKKKKEGKPWEHGGYVPEGILCVCVCVCSYSVVIQC